MSAHDHAGPHGDLHNADVHHEESDINVRAIIWFVVVLGGIVLVRAQEARELRAAARRAEPEAATHDTSQPEPARTA